MLVKKLWILGCAGVLMSAAPILANDGGGGNKPAHEAKGNIFTGRFTAVDAANNSVSLENKAGAKQTVTVAADAKIEVNGKPGTLADVQVGMYGGVKIADSGQAMMLKAMNEGGGKGGDKGGDKHSVFFGKVAGVNGNAISITSKEGGETKTFNVPADAKVQVNGQPANLAAITADMYGGVKLNGDGTVLEVRAYAPKHEKKD